MAHQTRTRKPTATRALAIDAPLGHDHRCRHFVGFRKIALALTGKVHRASPAPREGLPAAAAARGLALEIFVTATPARTAQEAASACGCSVAQIVKSLVFRGTASGDALLFLVSGANRLDGTRAAQLAGEAVVRPDAAFVRNATGYAIGGIPPLGHARPLRTFLDETLLRHPAVWAAAGTPDTVFAIDPGRLAAVTAATVAVLA